jgi:hypothetical protein
MDGNGNGPPKEGAATGREERHRRRARKAMMEMRRAFLTAAKELERFEAEEAADDAGGVAILPGHSAALPQGGVRPPRGMVSPR